MQIARYTRSFIGLMEMDKDGKWCLYEEVENNLKLKDDVIEYYHKYTKDCNEDFRRYAKKYLKQLDKNITIGMLLLISLLINIFQIII